jgi:hypothetical protein
MGQTLSVTVMPGVRAEVRSFTTDRSITGMAVERFPDAASAKGTKPPQVLARRLFELAGVRSVAVYSNAVTVEADASAWARLEAQVVATVEHLFEYYGDDAGWSVDALAKYGIERLPSPVQ